MEKLQSFKELPFDLTEYVRYHCFNDSAMIYQAFKMGRNGEDAMATKEYIIENLIRCTVAKLKKQFTFLKKRYNKYINDPEAFVDGIDNEAKYLSHMILEEEKEILEKRNSQTSYEELEENMYEGDGSFNLDVS